MIEELCHVGFGGGGLRGDEGVVRRCMLISLLSALDDFNVFFPQRKLEGYGWRDV